MSTHEPTNSARKLPPVEGFAMTNELVHRVDRPDLTLEPVWLREAEQRLAAHRTGQVKGIPAEAIFGVL